MNIHPVLEEVLNRGIEISLTKKDGVVKYDINTMMKSQCVISVEKDETDPEKNILVANMRYGKTEEIEDLNGLLCAVKSCMHGQSFGNHLWLDWLDEEGFLEKKIERKVTYV